MLIEYVTFPKLLNKILRYCTQIALGPVLLKNYNKI